MILNRVTDQFRRAFRIQLLQNPRTVRAHRLDAKGRLDFAALVADPPNFCYAMAACLVVIDALKVAMIKWRVPAGDRWNPQIAKRAYQINESSIPYCAEIPVQIHRRPSWRWPGASSEPTFATV